MGVVLGVGGVVPPGARLILAAAQIFPQRARKPFSLLTFSLGFAVGGRWY